MMQIWRVLVLVRCGFVRVLMDMPTCARLLAMTVYMVSVIVTVRVRVHSRDVGVRVPMLPVAHHPERPDHQRTGEPLLRRPGFGQEYPR